MPIKIAFLWLAALAPGISRSNRQRTVQAVDVGESNDIHPKDKQTVGKRLALAARGVA